MRDAQKRKEDYESQKKWNEIMKGIRESSEKLKKLAKNEKEIEKIKRSNDEILYGNKSLNSNQ